MRRLAMILSLCLAVVFALSALAQDLVPPSKGFWGVQNGKLVQLLRPEVLVKEYQGKDVKGFPKNTHFLVFDRNPRFILWDDFVNPSEAKAVMLIYEGKMMVNGEMLQTERWELDMWVRTGDAIEVMTAKIPNQQNMTQVYFKDPLKPGNYMIFFGARMADVMEDKYKNNLFVFEVK